MLSLQNGQLFRLPFKARSPGVSVDPPALWSPGPTGGFVWLEPEGPREEPDLSPVLEVAFAQPALEGNHAALLSEDRVQAFDIHDRGRRLVETRSAGWYPPALQWPWVAWVVADAAGEEQIWWMNAEEGTPPAPLDEGPGDRRHVISDGDRFYWVSPTAIIAFDRSSGDRQEIPARTGFSAPISAWGGEVCWEERGEGIDIRCSDGLEARGPGDQRWPSRFGPWLLYREGDRTMLRTAQAEPE